MRFFLPKRRYMLNRFYSKINSMKEEYKECPNCHNMVDKWDKECPYCLHQFIIWSTSFAWDDKIFWNNKDNPLENITLSPFLKSLLGIQNNWAQNLSKQEIAKRLRRFIIIFMIITRLIPMLMGLFSSILKD